METGADVDTRWEERHRDEELFVFFTKKNGVFSLDAFDGVIMCF